MGQFQKGEGGRPKGSPNKVSTELRQWLSDFLTENKGIIKEDWLSLKPRDRVILFEKLLKYALPTLQAVQLETEFDRLPDDQLEELINGLKGEK